MDKDTLDTVAKVYQIVVDAGVYRAESIKVAEAAKVIENSQRDINIAFMNELSIILQTTTCISSPCAARSSTIFPALR